MCTQVRSTHFRVPACHIVMSPQFHQEHRQSRSLVMTDQTKITYVPAHPSLLGCPHARRHDDGNQKQLNLMQLVIGNARMQDM